MKRFLAMTLSVVMAVSLAACGGKTETVPDVQGEFETAAVKPLTLYQSEKMDSEWGFCDAKWQNLYLSEEDAEKYPALAEALKEMNIEQDVYH